MGRHPHLRPGETSAEGLARLAGEARAAEIDRQRLDAQRTAALRLHRPATSSEGTRYCTRCMRIDWPDRCEPYPCPTARALGVTA